MARNRTATGEVRWHRRRFTEGDYGRWHDHHGPHRRDCPDHHEPVLQQEWRDGMTGDVTWEDVPTVDQEEST